MNERRFVIDRVENYHSQAPINIVTESELKRWFKEFGWPYEYEIPIPLWNRIVDLLLHGEGKEEPCYICHKVGGHEPFCSRSPQKGEERKQGHSRLVYDKETRSIKRVDDQPSPTPTRAEWEAATDYIAKAIMGRIEGNESRTLKIKNALLSMPCVPKGGENE